MCDKLIRLAEARGESIDNVKRNFTYEEITQSPKAFSKHLADLRKVDFKTSGIEGGLAYVELSDGHIFYSYISKANHRREYKYIKDTISENISEDAYLAAIDAVQRYITDSMWPPDFLLSSKGGNIIELGAYLGHKTVRFAEELTGQNGKVLAVEMIPQNAEILKRNIAANGLSEKVDVLTVGAWDEAGKKEIFSKGRQRNAISPIESLRDGERVTVRTETLDNIIDQWGRSTIELLFITVNGAEVEVLKEASLTEKNVNAIYIIAPYKRKSGANVDLCNSILKQKGYLLHNQEDRQRIAATLQC